MFTAFGCCFREAQNPAFVIRYRGIEEPETGSKIQIASWADWSLGPRSSEYLNPDTVPGPQTTHFFAGAMMRLTKHLI